MMERNPQARTVPQIFIDDQLIGGYTDLVEKYSK
jgi:thioredoxin reductase (NADPH)